MARRTPPPQLIGSGLIPETFQQEYAGYEDAYQSKLAGLGRDERNLFADYGFTGGVGEDGSVNFQADPNAQRGLYQQLLQNIGGQLGQAKNEVRGRGIGRAGLAKARENLIRFMMSGEKTGLLTNFNKGAANIFGQRGAALTDRNRNFNALEGRALDWWNQYGPDDPDGNVSEPMFGERPAASMAPDMNQPMAGGLPIIPDGGYENIDAGMGGYVPPAFAPTQADPYSLYGYADSYVPTARQVRRQRTGGGGGGPMQVM